MDEQDAKRLRLLTVKAAETDKKLVELDKQVAQLNRALTETMTRLMDVVELQRQQKINVTPEAVTRLSDQELSTLISSLQDEKTRRDAHARFMAGFLPENNQ